MVKSIKILINEITLWNNNNPGALFHKVYSVPMKLQYIIEAIVDDGTYEGKTKSFVIPLSSIIKYRVSNSQFRVIKRYFDACQEMRSAQQEFIKLFISKLS